MGNDNLYENPVALTQRLIQFNTVNGVHPEEECILFIRSLMEEVGMATEVYYKEKSRPNLLGIHRTKAERKLPPLLLYGHVDVASVSEQSWEVDPFSGVIKDGFLWGRGAIDMKGQHGIMLTALFQIIKEQIQLPFDIYYLAVSDEEGTGEYGMKYLVEAHDEIFDDIKYGIGEVGGFSFDVSGKKLYPIQIAEKQAVELKIIARGEGGHGSFKHKDTAMERLAGAVSKLSKAKLPVRVTPPVKAMIEAMAEQLGGIEKVVLRQLLNPRFTDFILGRLGGVGDLFDPLLHNSINVTVIGGGDAVNVIPSEVWCKCDLRMVPECKVDDAIREITQIIGDDFLIQILDYNKGAVSTDMELFSGMAQSLKKADEEACPVPFVLAAVTDGRFLSKIGIQSYGFTPMKFPKGYDFTAMAHNANERIPLEALEFGRDTLYDYIVNQYKEVCHG